MSFMNTFFVLILVKMPDFLTTWYGFSLHEVLDVKEGNPIARYIIKNTGFGGLFVYIVLLAALVSFSILSSNDMIANCLTFMWIVSAIIPATLNLYGIIRCLRALRVVKP